MDVCAGGPPRRDAGIPAVRDVRVRGWVSDGGLFNEWGEAEDSEVACCGTGDPDKDPALKGWNEMEGLLLDSSSPRKTGREICARPDTGREFGGMSANVGNDVGGELV